MTDIVSRLRSLSSCCAPGCEGRCKECPDEVIRDAAKALEHARKMSIALCELRPLGGSECFVRVGDEFYADTNYFTAMIRELRDELHEARKKEMRVLMQAKREASQGG